MRSLEVFYLKSRVDRKNKVYEVETAKEGAVYVTRVFTSGLDEREMISDIEQGNPDKVIDFHNWVVDLLDMVSYYG